MSSRPAGGGVSGRRSWDRLSESSRDARHRALQAVGLMRTDGVSLSTAAQRVGTTPRTVLRYAGPALTRSGGRYQAAAADRLYRRMVVATPEGPLEVDIRGSRVASLVGRHHNAIGRDLETGDPSHLAPFRGVRIEQLAARRELDIDDIYPHA